MDRTLTRTDPLLRQESYSYDLNGNVVSTTDRKKQVTTFSYDGLNRMKFVGFNTSGASYESTISYTYDAGNRMTQAVNACSTGAPGCVNGTITDAYDNLDRLTSEATTQGSISYGYDAAGRETSMQVAGQPAVNYTYDNANRVTQIAQSSSTTSFSYDNGNRRTSLTLPNGVVVSCNYDNDSRLTGITYTFGSSTLGNLSYAYDQLGRRTQVGGSFARTGLPGAVSSTSYDAANELTHWNGISLSYDANGNMLTDGSNAFTWNARNQVASLNNVSLQYDVFGRRTKNLAGTSFLYDGANAVQELSGTTVTANLISGGIDEVFSRTDSSGAFTQLKDSLGSTIALVDSSGNIDTSYTYDAFGGTSVTRTSNANEFQYTGRENEGNGLYFYRNRYYAPLFGRFISEDPLGFEGSGTNFYAYAFDSPPNFRDPLGLQTTAAPQVLDPTPVQVEQALRSVQSATEAAGAAEGATSVGTTAAVGETTTVELGAGFGAEIETGAAGGPIGVGVLGVAATGAIVYYGASAAKLRRSAGNLGYNTLILKAVSAGGRRIAPMRRVLLAEGLPR